MENAERARLQEDAELVEHRYANRLRDTLNDYEIASLRLARHVLKQCRRKRTNRST